MARAKNTDRAQARRRTREALRATEIDNDVVTSDATAVAVDPGPSMGTAVRGSMRMPDVREDLRILPGMILHTRKLWIPFIALFAAFIVAMLLSATTTTTAMVGGTQVSVVTGRIIPEGLDRIGALFVQLTLPPTALFVFFVGGFLAPRASYLVGAILGLVDGILWSIYVFTAPSAPTDGFATNSASDVLAIVFIAVMIGTLAAGFAAWYRSFLRSSQERARANRAAREQQMRAKAKEDERKAKEDQRKAAIAAREAARTGGSASKGTPPAG